MTVQRCEEYPGHFRVNFVGNGQLLRLPVSARKDVFELVDAPPNLELAREDDVEAVLDVPRR